MWFSLARAAFAGLGEAAAATVAGVRDSLARALRERWFRGAGVQERLFRGGVWGRVGARRTAGRAGRAGFAGAGVRERVGAGAVYIAPLIVSRD